MPPATAGAAGHPAAHSAAQAREQLLGLLGPLVEGAGYDLEDVTVSAAGRRSLVRVIVDADGGIDLDAVADVSRVVSEALDAPDGAAAGPLAGSYVLEVTSPGVDRPLREPRHWRRAAGRLVAVQAAGKPLTGRIAAAGDDGVLLEIDGRQRRVPWADLGPGKVQVEFNRAEDQR